MGLYFSNIGGVPDLVFFGESYSSKSDRSVGFQAKCVCDGLKKLRVYKFSVYAISYGGFVGYRMAEVYDDMVEKLVIVSSGIVCKHERKLEHVQKIGRSVVDLLVAKMPEDLRMLCRISIHKYDIGRWIPDFFLWGFIGLECCGKEKEELVHELLNDKPGIDLQILTQPLGGGKYREEIQRMYDRGHSVPNPSRKQTAGSTVVGWGR
ncbi:alpha/beta hydrolase fold-1 [Tanacetum coccineum]|uniref:Alpha/beta hydrolase fold-1 n=1 Tax=Tanacetum coccineum TaxID=301880 RepID=A0ABQ5F9V0_9ASTR